MKRNLWIIGHFIYALCKEQQRSIALIRAKLIFIKFDQRFRAKRTPPLATLLLLLPKPKTIELEETAMKNKISIILFTLFLMLSFGSVERVLACGCIESSICELYGSYEEVFVGKAVEIIREKRKTDKDGNVISSRKESTVFEISKTIQGKEKKEITVVNHRGFSCGTSFEKGKSYLVFAAGDEQEGFGTSMCSGNLPLSEASKALKELEKLKQIKTGGNFIGSVAKRFQSTDKDFVPMPNIKIQIRNVEKESEIFEGSTDEKGKYSIFVPKGKYEITPIIPKYANFKRIRHSKEILKIERGCVLQYFRVQNNSRVTGKVLDSTGKPIEDVRLELVLTHKEPKLYGGKSGYSDENGSFEITNIPSGIYTLSVNFTKQSDEEHPFPTSFYPGVQIRNNAQKFEIGLGQSIENIVYYLPPRITKRTVRGKLVFPEGSPAVGFTVNLQRGVSDRSFSYTKTDEHGNFELNGFLGEKYNFGIDYYGRISEYQNWTIKKSVFELDENTQSFRLVLKKKELEK
jgi:hypothetical protein